tara:strand:+ start:1776 stop:2300 length:525 start_codon:yes stop_codon:yes gene_type:complete
MFTQITMENDMKNLITKLEKLFADIDAKVLKAVEDNLRYAIQELQEYWSSKSNDQDVLKKIMTDCGIDRDLVGQIRFNFANNDADTAFATVLEMVQDPVLQKHEKRNYTIAKKLISNGISDLEAKSLEETVSHHALVQEWLIDNLIVEIRVIFAGGYNVQKLHSRTLCNVKECA